MLNELTSIDIPERQSLGLGAELPKVNLMGLKFDAISEADAIAHVLHQLRMQNGGWLCTANLDILRQWRSSSEIRHMVAAADLVVADGMPLVWASALQGTPLPERVAGSALTLTLTQAAAASGASVFFLGGNPGAADGAADHLRTLFSDLRVAGVHCPPFGFDQDPASMQLIGEMLEAAEPDLVYVGLGFPKQERLIAELRPLLPHTWFMSCGISFSFVAGEINRAPRLVQRFGLEWLHRLVQEPRRLGRRYLVDGIPFFFRLVVASLRARGRRRQ